MRSGASTGEKLAHVNCWISDGRIDYFAPFARPNTPFDFKLRVDLKSKRLSAWVSGRGDDDWFLVAEDVPLHTDLDVIDAVQVEMSPDAPVTRRFAALDIKGVEMIRTLSRTRFLTFSVYDRGDHGSSRR